MLISDARTGDELINGEVIKVSKGEFLFCGKHEYVEIMIDTGYTIRLTKEEAVEIAHSL